jgi:hypothetical protein
MCVRCSRHVVFARFPTRREVDNANNSRLIALSGVSHKYEAKDFAGYDSKDVKISPDQMERLLERLVAAKAITLKVSAYFILHFFLIFNIA